MNLIENLIEPRRLFLSWQPPMVEGASRLRRIVAVIERVQDQVGFRYLLGSDDLRLAEEEGFKGFPAFKLEANTYWEGVLEAFTRRLPPRKREDFREYLLQYRLPENFNGSDMSLLAYTGAKLPGDGFEIVADLTDIEPPVELVIEVAGFRYRSVSRELISIGDPVRFVPEPENEFDPRAIMIMHAKGHIGYVAKPYCAAMTKWLDQHVVEACIERINGKPDRPVIYLFVKVRSSPI